MTLEVSLYFLLAHHLQFYTLFLFPPMSFPAPYELEIIDTEGLKILEDCSPSSPFIECLLPTKHYFRGFYIHCFNSVRTFPSRCHNPIYLMRKLGLRENKHLPIFAVTQVLLCPKPVFFLSLRLSSVVQTDQALLPGTGFGATVVQRRRNPVKPHPACKGPWAGSS